MKKYLLLTLAFGAGFISSSIINNSTLSSQEEKVEYKIRKNLNAETVSAECMINGQAQQDTVVCEQISYGSVVKHLALWHTRCYPKERI